MDRCSFHIEREGPLLLFIEVLDLEEHLLLWLFVVASHILAYGLGLRRKALVLHDRHVVHLLLARHGLGDLGPINFLFVHKWQIKNN